MRSLIRPALLVTTSIVALTLSTEQVKADPISLAVAATVSSVAAAGSIGAFAFLGLTGWSGILASVVVRAALGYALNALAPRPNKVSRGYSVNSLGPALPHAIVYGETRIGGAVFYQTNSGGSNGAGATDNRYFHRMVAFAGHEIESFEAFYLNGEELTLDVNGDCTAPAQFSGVVRVNEHLGTDTQAADANAVSEITEWTTSHQAKGVAYAHVRYDYSTTAFPNGIPTLTARVRGKKLYDPRSASTAWGDNPALALRSYLTSSYGLNEPTDGVDDDLVSIAAGVCEETVAGADRYTCNGSFLLDSAPEDIVRTIASSMGGLFWFQGGKWSMRAAKYVAPTYTFNEDDLRSNIKISTKQPRRDNFNTVTGVYRGSETDYQEADYTPVSVAGYVTEDDGEEISTDLSLLFTDTDVMAQRIAKIALERNRRQITVNATFGMRAIDLRIGDTLQLTNTRAGWTNKVFEVDDWRFGFNNEMIPQINMILRETDSSVFA